MKTDQTQDLEHRLRSMTHDQGRGTFGCFEVTIGWYGKERVDYLTYDTKGIFRCYEVKVTKSDFHSPCAKSFLGHFNYYVMPEDLYEDVKGEIPDWVGVYVTQGNTWLRNIKKAKRQEVPADIMDILKDSMIRSLFRDADKVWKSSDVKIMEQLKRKCNTLEREKQQEYRRYWDLVREVESLYGHRWRRPHGKGVDG